jgi:hypothetical protein
MLLELYGGVTEATNRHKETTMNVLLMIALILVVLWVLGGAVFQITGFLLHLLLVIAVIMLILWAIRRMT